MSRIELTDSLEDVIVKMSEGNPGAVVALCEIAAKGGEIDPQAMLGGIGTIMMLDDMGIYGSSIYILANDKCGDLRRFMLLMRAHQLGFFPEQRLRELAADQVRTISISDKEWEEIDNKVCDRLDEFQKPLNS